MTYEEAIERLKVHFEIHDDGRPTPLLDDAEAMAYAAMKKQIPKKPIKKKMKIKDCIDQIKFFEETVCPSCGERMCCDWKFCFECGQSIDWSEQYDI